MYLEELRQKISGDKAIQALLKKMSQAGEKKANALSRQADITEKRREKKGQVDKIRARMKAVILEGKDPESLHREERDLVVSLESLNRWVEEIENEIIPAVDEEIKAIGAELKETVQLVLMPYRNEKRESFNTRLDELGDELIAFEKAIRQVTGEVGAYINFDPLHLSSRNLIGRIGPR